MDLQNQHANAAMVWMDIPKDAKVHVVRYPSADDKNRRYAPSAQYLRRFLANRANDFILTIPGWL